MNTVAKQKILNSMTTPRIQATDRDQSITQFTSDRRYFAADKCELFCVLLFRSI